MAPTIEGTMKPGMFATVLDTPKMIPAKSGPMSSIPVLHPATVRVLRPAARANNVTDTWAWHPAATASTEQAPVTQSPRNVLIFLINDLT